MNVRQKLTWLTRWFLFGNQIVDGCDAMQEGETVAFQDESESRKDGYLQYVSNGLRVRVDLDDGKTINVGNSFYTDCYIDSPDISEKHANFTRQGNEYYVEDNHSRQGTFVDGEKVPEGEKKMLHDGSIIKLGEYILRFYRRPAIGSDGRMKYAGTGM